jgi:hypothetical protein
MADVWVVVGVVGFVADGVDKADRHSASREPIIQ